MKQLIKFFQSKDLIKSIGILGFTVASILFPHLVIIFLCGFIYLTLNIRNKLESEDK
jgi:uncharacterized protein YybS (DUF2232 family)